MLAKGIVQDFGRKFEIICINYYKRKGGLK